LFTLGSVAAPDLSRHGEALAFFEEAKTLHEEVIAETDRDEFKESLAATLQGLSVHQKHRDPRRAEQLARRALGLRRELLARGSTLDQEANLAASLNH